MQLTAIIDLGIVETLQNEHVVCYFLVTRRFILLDIQDTIKM